MAKAIRFHKTGGPEVLQLDDVPVGEPGPGRDPHPPHRDRPEFHRRLPAHGPVPDAAAADARHGRRRRRRGGGRGRHAPEGGRPRRLRQQPAGRLLRSARDAGQDRCASCPTRIAFDDRRGDDAQGPDRAVPAAKTQPYDGLQPGDLVLFHAAAGGVGLIACQWAKALGLQLIGTAGSDEKCALAHGARRRARHQLPHGGLRRARQGDHRRQGRARWSTTRSARTPGKARSTACGRSA